MRNVAQWIALPVVAFVATAALYRSASEIVVDFERGYEDAFVENFHPRERADDFYFRWTQTVSSLVFRHLPASGDIGVEATLAAARPREGTHPLIRFTVNGVTVHQSESRAGKHDYRFDFPAPGTSVTIGIESDTFSAADGRALGVQARQVKLTRPDGGSWPLPALLMALACALLFGAARLAGAPIAGAVGFSGTFTAGFLFLLMQQGLRFSSYPSELVLLAAFALVITAALRLAFDRSDWLHVSERPLVTLVIVGSFLLKIGTLTYPLMLSSDALFHANRLSELLAGNWYLTSVTQHAPPFHIPYPFALFAISAPLASMGLDRVLSLELVAGLTDVAAGLAIIFLAHRFLNDVRAGILGAVLYQLVPLNGLAFSAGNLSNLFAAGTTTIAFALFAAVMSRPRTATSVGLLLLVSLSLTAHFGMFIEGMVLWPAFLLLVGLAVPPRPGALSRRPVVLATTAALVLVLLYYAGYWNLFIGQWERALERDYASGAAAVSGPLEKLRFNLSNLFEQLGPVFGALALLGSVGVVSAFSRTPFHAGAAAWLVTTFLFFFVDLLSALEVRYALQVLSLLALLAGVYLSSAWERGGVGRLAAWAATAYLALAGLWNLYECLLFRYH